MEKWLIVGRPTNKHQRGKEQGSLEGWPVLCFIITSNTSASSSGIGKIFDSYLPKM